jgi:hypothetical protein
MPAPPSAVPTKMSAELRSSAPESESASVSHWLAVIVFAVALGSMLLVGRELFFGPPVHEIGDLAANALQIDRAKELAEPYGNYSRFGFHHPGPAFFYIYAAAEALFHDALGLTASPHAAHLLGGAILQAAFLALTITVAATLTNSPKPLFAAVALVIASMHFALAGTHHLSIWPPSVLILPFAAFLVTCVAVSRGSLNLTPVMVFVAGFLVHGHVAQPLFVLPLGAIAYASGALVWFRRGVSVRTLVERHGVAHLASVGILVVFGLPVAVDAMRGSDSNLALIFGTLGAPRELQDSHGPFAIVAYVLAYLAYPVAGELAFTPDSFAAFIGRSWVAVAGVVLIAAVAPAAYLLAGRFEARRADPADVRQAILRVWAFVGLALVLALVWVAIQRGPLYQFNSFFVYGAIYVALLTGAFVVVDLVPRAATRPAVAALLGAVALTALAAAPPAMLAVRTTLPERVAEVVRSTAVAPEGVLLRFDAMHWNWPAGVALALERLEVRWFVEAHWGLIFGYRHAAVPAPPAPEPVVWTLAPPGGDGAEEIVLSDEIAIVPARPPGSRP